MQSTAAADQIPKILETLASPKDQPITERPRDESSRRKWLDKWLKLKTHHPQLVALEAEVYAFCQAYAQHPARGYRLVIWGENGTGKSHSARAVARWATSIKLKIPLVIRGDDEFGTADCKMFSWPDVVQHFKEGGWELFQRLLYPNLLVLDDLGAEHDPSKFACEKFCAVLEKREFKFTLITTNASPENWEKVFERRIASRLLRNSKIVSTEDVSDFSTIF